MKRRTLRQWSALLATMPAAGQDGLLTRTIPSSREAIPAVGLGTWITFNVGRDPPARARCVQVMRAFFEAGGRVIDSSPMYGSSQGVVGEGLQALSAGSRVFSADKVWTSSDGAAQVAASRGLWRVPRFDLLQVHNLVAWERQLPLLEGMKQRGEARHIGITTSEGRRHREFEEIMRGHRLDFVQLTYNPLDREPEQRLLPLAAERGIAVLVNRPFREGALLRGLQQHPLPGWAAEIGARSWAQVVLKFILGHPAVTCAIPATRRVDHVRENLAACRGPLPDAALRQRIAAHIAPMSEWWTYGPSDFLMFSPEAYWRLVARHNAAWWPAQVLGLAAAAGLPFLLRRGTQQAARAAIALLALAWLWVGWAFHANSYAEIFLAAPWLAAACGLQGAMLLAATAWKRNTRSVSAGGVPVTVGTLAVMVAVFYPLEALVQGRGWAQAEVFGFMPDPTALATLGVLLALPQPRAWIRALLAAIPVLSLLLGAATRWLLASP